MPSSITKSALFALVGVLALVDSAHAAASDGVCDYLLTAKACKVHPTQSVCNADTTCEWHSTDDCIVKDDSNDAIRNLALAKTDAVSVDFKTKEEYCEGVTQQSTCSSGATYCQWASGSCELSGAYEVQVTTTCAASSASTSFVAVQTLVVATVAAALLA